MNIRHLGTRPHLKKTALNYKPSGEINIANKINNHFLKDKASPTGNNEEPKYSLCIDPKPSYSFNGIEEILNLLLRFRENLGNFFGPVYGFPKFSAHNFPQTQNLPGSGTERIIKPGQKVTMDYLPGRLNISVNEQGAPIKSWYG